MALRIGLSPKLNAFLFRRGCHCGARKGFPCSVAHNSANSSVDTLSFRTGVRDAEAGRSKHGHPKGWNTDLDLLTHASPNHVSV